MCNSLMEIDTLSQNSDKLLGPLFKSLELIISFLILLYFKLLFLRWPNTVLARAFADTIQHVHKDFKKQTCCQ